MIKDIAIAVHKKAGILQTKLNTLGFKNTNEHFFDTISIEVKDNSVYQKIKKTAIKKGCNLFYGQNAVISISVDEATSVEDLNEVLACFVTTTIRIDGAIAEEAVLLRIVRARFGTDVIAWAI